MTVYTVKNEEEKEAVSRCILEALPDWFGIPSAREQYISYSKSQI